MSDPARLFIALYTDEDVTSELAPALRERGFEAQSAAEAGLLHADDARQLAYAAAHDLTLLTCNASHFLRLARQYAAAGQSHAGIIISSEQYSRRRFGELLRLTLRVMNTLTVDELRNTVVYLQQFK
jgi:predicted nuclease of predicted toxin-antitoxin system